MHSQLSVSVPRSFNVWMVEGEKDHEDEYDEGPSSRNKGALPPGMAAVDAMLAECIEDAFSVGYTDESLAKLLTEAISYIPPGSSIQVRREVIIICSASYLDRAPPPRPGGRHGRQQHRW